MLGPAKSQIERLQDPVAKGYGRPAVVGDDRSRVDAMTNAKAPVAQADTRWSLVAAARGGDSPGSVQELCARYWYAVYAFLRRSGNSPALAQDIARCFFHRLVSERLGTIDTHSKGRFRDFVLSDLRALLVQGWRTLPVQEPLAGLGSPLRVDQLESRYATDCNEREPPERAFADAFAQTVVTHSLERLRAEAEAAGRGALYAGLQPYIASEPGADQQAAICAALGVRPLVVVLGLRSLRHRLRELIDQELAETSRDGADIDAERRTLRIALPD